MDASPRHLARRLLAAAAICALLALAHAHGSLVGARGTLHTHSIKTPQCAREISPDSCPHCLNGGGKGAVMLAAANNWRLYDPLGAAPPRVDHAPCGDAVRDARPRPHERGGRFGPSAKNPYVAIYRSAQVVEFVVDVTTNHNGFFEFFICDVAKCAGDISEKCFQDGHCRRLLRKRTAVCESQKTRECAPIDPKYPGRWYVPCRKGNHVGEHFMGGRYMRYKLPKGFKCKDCVIQWYWASANSCNPPGFKEFFDRFPMPGWGRCPGDGGAWGGRNPTLATCGGPSFPEEFWGCADVRVTGPGVPPPNSAPVCSMKSPITEPPTIPPDDDDDVDDADDKEKEEEPEKRNVDPKKAQPKMQMPQRQMPQRQAPPTMPPRLQPQQMRPQQPRPQQPRAQPPRQRQSSPPHNRARMPVSGAKTAENCGGRLEYREDDETTPDAKNATCASNWKQCGGHGFTGAVDCCTPQFECIKVNKYYAQCKAPRRSAAQRART